MRAELSMLRGEVLALENGEGLAGAEMEEMEFVKGAERAALHKVWFFQFYGVEVLTAKLEKVERNYEGAEEYITGLEAELQRQEEILEQVSDLEAQLVAAHARENENADVVSSLQEQLRDGCPEHVDVIAALQAEVNRLASLSESVEVKDATPRGLEEPGAPVSEMEARARAAEDKLAFLLADATSMEDEVDFGDLDLASSTEYLSAMQEKGLASGFMDRLGFGGQKGVEETERKLAVVETFNRRLRDDVEVLKARIRVLTKAARRSPPSRSVSFLLPTAEATTQSEEHIIPPEVHERALEEREIAHASLASAAQVLAQTKMSLTALQEEVTALRARDVTLQETLRDQAEVLMTRGLKKISDSVAFGEAETQTEATSVSLEEHERAMKVHDDVCESLVDQLAASRERCAREFAQNAEFVQSLREQLDVLMTRNAEQVEELSGKVVELNGLRETLVADVRAAREKELEAIGQVEVLESALNLEKAKRRSSVEITEELRNLWIKLDEEEHLGRKKSVEITRLEQRLDEVLLDLAQSREVNAKVPELQAQLDESTAKTVDAQKRILILQTELDQVQATLWEMRKSSRGQGSDMDAMHLSEMIASSQQTVKDRVTSLQAELEIRNPPPRGPGRSISTQSDLVRRDVGCQSDVDGLQFYAILKGHEKGQAELKASKERATQLETRNAQLQKSVDALEFDLQSQADKAKVHAKSMELTASVTGSRGIELDSDDTMQLKAEVADLKARLAGLQELRSEVFNVAVRHHSAEDMRVALAQIETLTKQLETMSFDYAEKVESLNKELEQTHSSRQAAVSSLEQVREEVSRMSAELAQVRSEFSASLHKLALTEAQAAAVDKLYQASLLLVSELERRLEAVQAHYDVLIRQLEHAGITVTQSLTERITELETKRNEISAALKSEVLSLQAAVSSLQGELLSANEALQAKTIELVASADGFKQSQAELTSIKARLAEVQGLLEAETSVHDSTKTAARSAAFISTQVIAAHVNHLSSLQKELQDAKLRYSEALESRAGSLSSSEGKLKVAQESWAMERAEAKEVVVKLEQKLATVNTTLSVITQQYQDALEDCENLRMQLAEAHADLDQVERELDEEIAAMDSETQRANELEARLEQVQIQNETLIHKLVKAQTDTIEYAATCNNQVGDMQQRLDQVQGQHETLVAELESDHQQTRDLHAVAKDIAADLEQRLSEAAQNHAAEVEALRRQVLESSSASTREVQYVLESRDEQHSMAVRELEGKHKAAMDLHANTSQEVETLQKVLNDTRQEHVNVVEDYVKKFEESQSVVATSIARISELESLVSSERKFRDTEIADSVNKYKATRDLLAASVAKCSELESTLSNLTDTHLSHISELKVAHTATRELHDAAESRANELESRLAFVQEQRDIDLSNLESRHEGVRELHVSAEARLKDLEQRLLSIQHQHETLLTELESKHNDQYVQTKKVHDGAVQLLETSLAESRAALAATSLSLADAAKERDKRNDRMIKGESSTAKVLILEQQLSEAQKQHECDVAELELKHEASIIAQEQYDATVMDLNRALQNRDVANAALKSELTTCSHQLAVASNRFAELEADLRQHKEVTAELSTKLESTCSQLTVSTTKHSELESRIAAMKVELYAARDLHISVASRADELEERAFALQQQHDILVADLQSKYFDGQDAVNKLKRRVVELELSLAEAWEQHHVQISALEEDNTRTRELHSAASSKVSELDGALVASKSDSEAKILSLQMANQQAQESLELKTKRVHELDSLLSKQATDMVTLNGEHDSTRQVVNASSTAILQLESQLFQARESETAALKNASDLEVRLICVQEHSDILASRLADMNRGTQEQLTRSMKSIADLETHLTGTHKHHELIITKLSNEHQLARSLDGDKIRGWEARLGHVQAQHEFVLSGLKEDHDRALSGLMGRYSETDSSRSALLLENGSLKSQIASMEDKLRDNELAMEKLREEEKRARTAFYDSQESVNQLSSISQSQVLELQVRIQTLQQQQQEVLTRMEAEHQKTRELHEAATSQVKSLEVSLQAFQGTSETHNTLQLEHQRLQLQYSLASQQVGNLELRLSETQKQYERLISRLDADTNHTRDLHYVANDKAKDLEARLEYVQKQHESLMIALEKDHQSVVNHLISRVSEAEKTRNNLAVSTTTLEKQCQDLMQSRNLGLEKLTRLETEIVSLRTVLDGKDVAMQASAIQSATKIAELEARIASLMEQYEESMGTLQLDHQTTRDLHSVTKSRLEVAHQLISEHGDEKASFMSRIDSFAKQISGLTEMHAVNAETFAKEIGDREASHKSVAQELNQCQQQLQETTMELLAMQDRESEARNEADDLRARLVALQNEHDVLCSNLIDKLQSQTGNLGASLESMNTVLTEKSAALADVMQKKTLETSELQSKVSKLQRRTSDLEAELARCEETIIELKEKVRGNESDEAALRNLWIKLDREEDLGRKKSIEISRLEGRIEEVLAQLTDSREQSTRISVVEEQLKSVTEARNSARDLHSKAITELDEWKSQANEHLGRAQSLEASLSALELQQAAMFVDLPASDTKSTPAMEARDLPVGDSREIPSASHEIAAPENTNQAIVTLSQGLEAALKQLEDVEDQHAYEVDDLKFTISTLNAELNESLQKQASLQSQILAIQRKYETTVFELRTQLGSKVPNASVDYAIAKEPNVITKSIPENAVLDQSNTVATLSHGLQAALAQLDEFDAEHQKEVDDLNAEISRLEFKLAESIQKQTAIQQKYDMVVTELRSEREIRTVIESTPVIKDFQLATETVNREVVTSDPQSPQVEVPIFSSFTDEHWYLLSQELLRKDDRIKDLEVKLEMVAGIPAILQKWEETFEEQETDIENLELELGRLERELASSKQDHAIEVTRIKSVHETELENLRAPQVASIPSRPIIQSSDITAGRDELAVDIQSHPSFEAIAIQFAEKNTIITDLEAKLANLATVPDVLKNWENAFKEQEDDIDALESELDAANAEIRRLQTIHSKMSEISSPHSIAENEDIRSGQLSAQSFNSANTTLIHSASATPVNVYRATTTSNNVETFDIAFDEKTNEYYIPDGSDSAIMQTVDSKEYIEILHKQIFRLERSLSDSRSRIISLQSQVSNLELANQDASLRVSRARADLIEANTARRLVEARLNRIRERTICHVFKTTFRPRNITA
ncbi:hypothetical protein BC830DRAFT_1095240 [Chytriomyces sp. MP71]|nr:hypothetical protein BC830DRAFT_1095240 [Chytriomyces sp. MP71]